MALTVYLQPENRNDTLRFTGGDSVYFRVPINNGEYAMGFTVFLVAAGVQSVEVLPDTEDVTLPSFRPALTVDTELGILRNLNGSNNWSYTVARPYLGTEVNEEKLITNKVLDDTSVAWQVFDCNGSDRIVDIRTNTKGKEFLIINDGELNDLLLREDGVDVQTLSPGESLWCKRLTTKWIALRFAQYGISSN